MLKCEKKHQNKQVLKRNILTECFNILRIFFLISEKTKCHGSKRHQCDHFRTTEKAQCGADLAATGQCSSPLHNTDLQNRCQKRHLLYNFGEKNDAGVENDPSFTFLGLLTVGLNMAWGRFRPQDMFRPLLPATG